MAQAGGAAGAGGVGGGGGGAEDVPDVRFLLADMSGNKKSPLMFEMTIDMLERLFIKFLESENVEQEELELVYEVSDSLNRQQRPAVVQLNGRAAHLIVPMYRKRRHVLFLKIMLRAFGGRKNIKIQVPHKYRDPNQLAGDIKALEGGLESLFAQVLDLCDQVKAIGGIPVKVPHVFEKPIQLPKGK